MSEEDMKDYPQEIQDRIREVAYLMWESAGRQYGMAMEYWLQAEHEVLKATQTAAEKMMPTADDVKTVVDAVSEPLSKVGVKLEASTTPAKPAPTPAPAPAKPAQAAKPASAAKPAPTPEPAKSAPAAKPAPAPEVAKLAPAKPAAAAKPAPQPAKPAKATASDLEEIEGIGPAFKKKLNGAGITSKAELLNACTTPNARKATAEKSGISAKNILKWANMADLMRISGIDGQFAELLEAAGVDTVKELRMRRPDNLAAKMSEVNSAKKLTPSVPTEAQVGKWIEAAKALEAKLTY